MAQTFRQQLEEWGRTFVPYSAMVTLFSRLIWPGLVTLGALFSVRFFPNAALSKFLAGYVPFINGLADIVFSLEGFLSAIIVGLIIYHRWVLSRRLHSVQHDMVSVLTANNSFLRQHLELKKIIETHIDQGKNDIRDYRALPIAQHMADTCNVVAQIFQTITTQRCHCSFKMFDPATGCMSTKARDILLHNAKRRLVDEHKRSFPYAENTAFKRIFDEVDVDMYCNNDLVRTHKNDEYVNGNPNWSKLYNSCVVFPVTDKSDPTQINRQTCHGFLCVDSLRAKFDADLSREILLQYSLRLNNLLVELNRTNVKLGDI